MGCHAIRHNHLHHSRYKKGREQSRPLYCLISASILRFAMSAEVVDDYLQVRCIRASIRVEVVPA
jgi:hypothetical protein